MGATSTLFERVRVFDGRSDRLSDPVDVLVAGRTIAAVGGVPAAAPEEEPPSWGFAY